MAQVLSTVSNRQVGMAGFQSYSTAFLWTSMYAHPDYNQTLMPSWTVPEERLVYHCPANANCCEHSLQFRPPITDDSSRQKSCGFKIVMRTQKSLLQRLDGKSNCDSARTVETWRAYAFRIGRRTNRFITNGDLSLQELSLQPWSRHWNGGPDGLAASGCTDSFEVEYSYPANENR